MLSSVLNTELNIYEMPGRKFASADISCYVVDPHILVYRRINYTLSKYVQLFSTKTHGRVTTGKSVYGTLC